MRSGFGAQLSDDSWRALVEAGRHLTFHRDEIILRQGSTERHVLLLRSGTVKVVRQEPSGRRVFLAVRGPGEALGELAALDEERSRSATVIGMADGSLSVLAASRFQGLIDRLGLQGMVSRHLLARFCEAEELRAELLELASSQRLARCLLRIAQTCGPRIALTQDELTQAVGLSRSAIAAELAALRRQGILETNYGALVIRHAGALAEWPDSHRTMSNAGQSHRR
ncbi:Crp/Fnr family transcriptional regulator [Actinomadura nitritigenes]|uniref:Crp/Fnr family transcriptional regulator n=1 Tax=Actinomadura nitritigenes TaxID=134602 RepID=UPI00367A3454